jgi:uncharacterized integral membrane protein
MSTVNEIPLQGAIGPCNIRRMKTTVWAFMIAATLALAIWLIVLLPTQAWAEWDGKQWQLVGTGWATLWRGWPLLVAGALLGSVLVGVWLRAFLVIAAKGDYERRIARLTAERDEAQTKAQKTLTERLSLLEAREKAARDAKQEADEVIKAAHAQAADAKTQARQQVEKAGLRARNAICAAERIKRKHGKAPKLSVR